MKTIKELSALQDITINELEMFYKIFVENKEVIIDYDAKDTFRDAYFCLEDMHLPFGENTLVFRVNSELNYESGKIISKTISLLRDGRFSKELCEVYPGDFDVKMLDKFKEDLIRSCDF